VNDKNDNNIASEDVNYHTNDRNNNITNCDNNNTMNRDNDNTSRKKKMTTLHKEPEPQKLSHAEKWHLNMPQGVDRHKKKP